MRELYGDALNDPDARFELELALRTTGVRVRLFSATAPRTIDSRPKSDIDWNAPDGDG